MITIKRMYRGLTWIVTRKREPRIFVTPEGELSIKLEENRYDYRLAEHSITISPVELIPLRNAIDKALNKVNHRD